MPPALRITAGKATAAGELNTERHDFYELLWHTGASQTDVASSTTKKPESLSGLFDTRYIENKFKSYRRHEHTRSVVPCMSPVVGTTGRSGPSLEPIGFACRRQTAGALFRLQVARKGRVGFLVARFGLHARCFPTRDTCRHVLDI